MRKEVMEQRQNVLGKKAAEEGKAYLAENAKKKVFKQQILVFSMKFLKRVTVLVHPKPIW